MKDSAPSRELQSHSNWKVMVPVGTEGPLLLAHAINDPYLTFCSQKYMSIKLLFLLFCRSFWDFCQPCIGFLSVMLLLGLHSCCLLLFVCLPCDMLGRVLSESGVLMPSAMVHEHKQTCLEAWC